MSNHTMNLDPAELFPDADASFQHFFESLGYRVYREGKMETGERWYEICDPDEGVLCFQISMPPPPIIELVADLPHLIEGRSGVGPTDYWCACDDDSKLRELLSRIWGYVFVLPETTP